MTYFVVSGGAVLIVPAHKYSRFTVKGHTPATLQRKTSDKKTPDFDKGGTFKL